LFILLPRYVAFPKARVRQTLQKARTYVKTGSQYDGRDVAVFVVRAKAVVVLESHRAIFGDVQG